MQPSGAQWGISKFFVSIYSDAHHGFFFKFVSRTNDSNTKPVWTSLNKSKQKRRVTTNTMSHRLQCMQPPAQCFLLQTTTDADPSLCFFPNLFTCKYLKYISTISVQEGAQWEISKFFFKPLLMQTWVIRWVNRSEKFGRILKYTSPGQPDGGGVQKSKFLLKSKIHSDNLSSLNDYSKV